MFRDDVHVNQSSIGSIWFGLGFQHKRKRNSQSKSENFRSVLFKVILQERERLHTCPKTIVVSYIVPRLNRITQFSITRIYESNIGCNKTTIEPEVSTRSPKQLVTRIEKRIDLIDQDFLIFCRIGTEHRTVLGSRVSLVLVKTYP
jgi:hypothetical protein